MGPGTRLVLLIVFSFLFKRCVLLLVIVAAVRYKFDAAAAADGDDVMMAYSERDRYRYGRQFGLRFQKFGFVLTIITSQ